MKGVVPFDGRVEAKGNKHRESIYNKVASLRCDAQGNKHRESIYIKDSTLLSDAHGAPCRSTRAYARAPVARGVSASAAVAPPPRVSAADHNRVADLVSEGNRKRKRT